jgi:chemotaxis signal transduction protein
MEPRSGSSVAPLARAVCAFWLGDRCYGIDIALVGEIVQVDRVAPVPLARPGVLGVFSLRGAPTALVDLARVLGLPGGDEPARGRTVLVLRSQSDTLCGAPIQRVEAIVPLVPERVLPPSSAVDNEVVSGFLEARAEGQAVITLIDTRRLAERLAGLRHGRGVEESFS